MKNNKTTIFILFFVFLSLISCDKKEEENIEIKKEKINTQVYDFKSFDNYKTNNEIWKKLFIDEEKCIWCGKCVRFAPENFIMNFKKLKAEVISSKNIDLPWVQRSIQICPTDAISVS